MTSWSLIEDGPLTPQVPVGWVRGQPPSHPPVQRGAPHTGWLAVPAQETGLLGFVPSRNQRARNRLTATAVPSPALLSTCASQGLTPTHPHTSRPLCQPIPQGQDDRMRCGGQEVGDRKGGRNLERGRLSCLAPSAESFGVGVAASQESCSIPLSPGALSPLV